MNERTPRKCKAWENLADRCFQSSCLEYLVCLRTYNCDLRQSSRFYFRRVSKNTFVSCSCNWKRLKIDERFVFLFARVRRYFFNVFPICWSQIAIKSVRSVCVVSKKLFSPPNSQTLADEQTFGRGNARLSLHLNVSWWETACSSVFYGQSALRGKQRVKNSKSLFFIFYSLPHPPPGLSMKFAVCWKFSDSFLPQMALDGKTIKEEIQDKEVYESRIERRLKSE